MQTNDPVHFTNAWVIYYLKVTLDTYEKDYPNEASYFNQFRLKMRNCIITSFTKDADKVGADALEYILYTPVNKFDYTAWVPVHDATTLNSPATDCGYVVQYTSKWRTFYDTELPLPDFIHWQWPTWDPSSTQRHSLWVQSDKLIDVTTERQTYVVEITGTILTTDMNPTITQTQKM